MPVKKLVGPPGTGKTETLLRLLEVELKVVPPDRVAFLTFTRSARAEALSRCGRPAEELPYLRTIHAICYRQQGISAQQLIRPKNMRYFSKLMGLSLTGVVHDPWMYEDSAGGWSSPTKDDRLLALNHLGRHRLMDLRETLRHANDELSLELPYATWLTHAYRDWKRSESLYDYTDLLTSYLDHGASLPIDVMFIDEAQDLSPLQWEVVHKLGARAERSYIAGDDDQALFAWCGASADLFIDEPADETIVLNQSKRLPRRVHRVATDLVERIRGRIPKDFRPRDAEGGFNRLGYLTEEDLAGDTLVLFRNHYRGSQLAKMMEQLSWPFAGPGTVLADEVVQQVLAGWTAIISNQLVSSAQAQALVNVGSPLWFRTGAKVAASRSGGSLSWSDLLTRRPVHEDWHAALFRLPGREYIARCEHFHGWSSLLNPTTRLMSIHQSKGREADNVVLDLEMAQRTYQHWVREPDDETRVWYVGATRARERLMTLEQSSSLMFNL